MKKTSNFIIFTFLIPLYILCSCSVQVKPTPPTKRLTKKHPYQLGINLEKIEMTLPVRGSFCAWPFTLGFRAWSVQLREAIKNASEYSFVDFFERVETVQPSRRRGYYNVIFKPIIKDFNVSAFLSTSLMLRATFTDQSGKVIYEKEISGESQISFESCCLGSFGSVFFQGSAIGMSVKSAIENAFEQLYQDMLNNMFIDDAKLLLPGDRKIIDKKDLKKEKKKAPDFQTIYLKDGSKIVGKIISQTRTHVTIKTKYTTITINKKKIDKMKYK